MGNYDYLIVGSGLFGAVFAYRAKMNGKRSLVIEKRSNLGGNLYCENIEGINVHKYGAHIFHTSNKEVWDFVNSIVEFNQYRNSPIANYNGKLYNLPFNMNTFYQIWGVTTPEQAKIKLEEQCRDAIERMKKDGVSKPRNLEEQALVCVGEDIYTTLIKGYTEKQWGRKCTELPAFIINRVPVRFVYDNNYFNDVYQGVPKGGYNKLIDGLLNGIETKCNVDYFENRVAWNSLAEKVVFTGKLDEYFDYRYGKLEYRALKFKEEVLDVANYQGNAVVNFVDPKTPFTRIIEHKHFESFGKDVDSIPKTVISREYPLEWDEGFEPYYPIENNANSILANMYRELALQENNVFFGGRLAEYKYYDMAPIIEKVLSFNF